VHVGRDAKLGQSPEVRPACVRPECLCVRARLLILSKHPLHPRSHAHSLPQGVTVEVFVNENKTKLTMTVDENYRCTFASGKLRPDAVQAQALGRILVSVSDVCVCARVECAISYVRPQKRCASLSLSHTHKHTHTHKLTRCAQIDARAKRCAISAEWQPSALRHPRVHLFVGAHRQTCGVRYD
jgi:hypothetical protein